MSCPGFPQVPAADPEGWTLAFSDNFERDLVADDWKALNGDWRIEKGWLKGRGEINCILRFPGPQRVEYDARSAEDSPRDDPLVSDLSGVLACDDNGLKNGYFFGFGSDDNTCSKILVLEKEIARYGTLIKPFQTHHVVCEWDGEKLTHIIDGEVVRSETPEDRLTGSRHEQIGFYLWQIGKVDNVRVYTRTGKAIYPDITYSLTSLGDPRTDSKLKIRVRNRRETSLDLRTELTVRSSSGKPFSGGVTVLLAPEAQEEISIPYEVGSKDRKDVPLGDMRVVEFALTLSNAATGEIYDSRKDSRKGGPTIDMSTDRYYYPPDAFQARVVLTRKTEQGVGFNVEIRRQLDAKIVAGKRIALVAGREDHHVFFDIRDWDTGRYVVSGHLLDEKGRKLRSIHRVFIKREIVAGPAAPSALRAGIRSDGILLLDGKPFCPFFACPSDTSSPLAGNSFNVKYGATGLVSSPLDRPEIGLPWVTREKGDVFILLAEEEEMQEGIRKAVSPRTTDPSLLCRLLKYEAEIPLRRGEERVLLNNVEEFRKIGRFVKSIDPDHLTSIHVHTADHLSEYKDLADIVEMPNPRSSYATWPVPGMGEGVDEIKRILGEGKPLFLWIGSSIPSAEHRTAEEIRCVSYLALLHGAAGLVFHMGHGGIDPSLTRHWSVYPGLSREVEELFPILSAPQPSSPPPIKVGPAQIDYCLREYKERLFLVAVNTSDRLVKATITIEDRSSIPKGIKLPFENREIKPGPSGFTDAFTAFEPHLYELSM